MSNETPHTHTHTPILLYTRAHSLSSFFSRPCDNFSPHPTSPLVLSLYYCCCCSQHSTVENKEKRWLSAFTVGCNGKIFFYIVIISLFPFHFSLAVGNVNELVGRGGEWIMPRDGNLSKKKKKRGNLENLN